MKALLPLVALAFTGTVHAQASQPQPLQPELRSSDVRVQSVPARAAAAPRSTQARARAAELSAAQPTFLDRSKQEYFDQIPLFRDAPTFRSSETQSTAPSATAGLAEALGLGSR
jgi:hypothetical protein